MAATADLSDLVQTALDRRDADASAAVIAAGDDAVPELAARLEDADPDAKADIIGLLREIGTPLTINSLASLMADPDYDTRVRATEAVYSAVMTHGAPQDQAFADAVIAAIQGTPAAGALLLGGLVPGADAVLKAQAGETRLVKLAASEPPVPAGVAATVALSLLGDAEARTRLERSIQAGDPAELEFYVTVMPMIDSPTILHALAAATLSNEAPVADGLPSGVEPSRRLADIATEAFVRRLDLDPGFELDETARYPQDARDKVAALITAAIPQ